VRVPRWLLAAILCLPAVAPATALAAPTVTEFTTNLTPSSRLEEIVTGSDGNLWFTENNDPGRIGTIDTSGAIAEFTAGSGGFSANGGPLGITAGPDGNVWFTENDNPGRVAKITHSGAVTEFTGGSTPNFSLNKDPAEITRGPDGNVWFTEYSDPGAVVRITPTGTVTEFRGGVAPGLTANFDPSGITTGPDGNIWFTEITPAGIGRITPSGHVTEFRTGVTPDTQPLEITTGPDGNLWFTEFNDPGAVGRITPHGQVTEFVGGVTPGFRANSAPTWITAGPDGNLWFTEYNNPGAIARITPEGQVTEYSAEDLPGFTTNYGPYGISTGPDHNLWFVDFNDPGTVSRMTVPPGAVTGAADVSGSRGATVRGTANGAGRVTSYRFEFGTTSAYGSSTGPVGIAPGPGNVNAAAHLTGLTPSTIYHYRISATSSVDTTHGVDRTFTTPPLPVIGKVKVKPKRWRRGSKLPQLIGAKKRKKPPVGTRIRFALNRAEDVRLAFFLKKKGKKKPVRVGAISLACHAGENTVRFQGRLSKKKRLKPGRYRLKVSTLDPTVTKNPTGTARFRIVKG
jgi:streptogramin lyase